MFLSVQSLWVVSVTVVCKRREKTERNRVRVWCILVGKEKTESGKQQQNNGTTGAATATSQET